MGHKRVCLHSHQGRVRSWIDVAGAGALSLWLLAPQTKDKARQKELMPGIGAREMLEVCKLADHPFVSLPEWFSRELRRSHF